jgi:hypothetical protein
MIPPIMTIKQVRVEDIPLPVPSRNTTRALQMCTSISNMPSRDAPVLEGMVPLWNLNHKHNTVNLDVIENADDDPDNAFPALMCESRAVRELVQLCIMSNVSSVNNVLLMKMPQQATPLPIFAYMQVSCYNFSFCATARARIF